MGANGTLFDEFGLACLRSYTRDENCTCIMYKWHPTRVNGIKKVSGSISSRCGEGADKSENIWPSGQFKVIIDTFQEAAARPPPPHSYVGGGWVVLRPQSRFLAIFLKCPSGRKRPCFLMARLSSFFAMLWFALLFDLCGLRLKIRCYSAFSFLGTLVQFYPKSTPNSKWP